MSNPAVVHSKLSFSARKRWKNCPDSVLLSAGFADKTSPYAAEGTAAHSVAEFYVRQAFGLPGALPGDPLDIPVTEGLNLKGRTPEAWNEDMRRHGRAYVEFIRGLIPAGAAAHVTIEQRVAIPSIHPQLFGTADCLVWLPELRRLVVVDYKYGFEDVAVGDAENTNEQLAAYVVAGAETFGLEPAELCVAIFQPRRVIGLAGQSEMFTSDWLPAERNKLRREVAAVDAATGQNPNAGDWCRYCRAKPICPRTHNAAAAALAVYTGERSLHSMTDDEVVQLWAARSAFKGFWEDVEERIELLAQAGHARLQVTTSDGRRKWKDDAQVTLTLLAMGRTDLLEPKALSTVFDKLPAFARDELIARGSPTRSIKLVDPGTPSQIAKLFKKYSNIVDAQVKGE